MIESASCAFFRPLGVSVASVQRVRERGGVLLRDVSQLLLQTAPRGNAVHIQTGRQAVLQRARPMWPQSSGTGRDSGVHA